MLTASGCPGPRGRRRRWDLELVVTIVATLTVIQEHTTGQILIPDLTAIKSQAAELVRVRG